MIPSPTKLALLTGIVLLASPSGASPARYDQRQDGDLNFRADVEDVVVIAAPPKEYFANGLAWIGANFIRHNPNRIPSRAPSKHGFVPTEKSPYKVDLGKSSVSLIKLESPAVDGVQLYKIREGDVNGQDESKVLVGVIESDNNKTVKKDLKTTETATAAGESQVPDDGVTTEKAEDAVTEVKGSGVKVVGVGSDPSSIMGLEDCGPDAHRNSKGVCVYE